MIVSQLFFWNNFVFLQSYFCFKISFLLICYQNVILQKKKNLLLYIIGLNALIVSKSLIKSPVNLVIQVVDLPGPAIPAVGQVCLHPSCRPALPPGQQPQPGQGRPGSGSTQGGSLTSKTSFFPQFRPLFVFLYFSKN